MRDEIANTLDGNYGKLLCSLVSGERKPSKMSVDKSKARKNADSLCNKNNSKEDFERVCLDVLSTNDYGQINETVRVYAEDYQLELETQINDEIKGDLKDAFSAISKY